MRRINYRAVVLTSLLAMYVSLSAQANAQEGGTIVEPTQPDDAGPRPGEIVVTAQRRSENLQDVPISITALTSETLENSGIQDTRDLPLLTPGLRVDSVGTYVQPAIRGITTTLTSGPEANVATYLDGVYRPNTFGAVYDLPDVHQIEVLKGPQGTLFGRNATGGAILITTRSPDLDEFTGQIRAGYGSFEAVTLDGFVSVPLLTDKVALSLTGYYDKVSDGWKRNLRTGEKEGATLETGLVRGKLRFLPWEGADIVLTGLYSFRKDGSTYKPSIFGGFHDFAGRPGIIIPSRPWEYAVDVDATHDARDLDVSLRGNIELGRGTLTTTSAYSHSWGDLVFDPDNVGSGNLESTTDTKYETVTQELVYATEQMGAVRAVAGVFFFDTDSGTEPFFSRASGTQIWFQDEATSYAAFGELTFDVTHRLSITGGLRYSYEKRKARRAIVRGQPPFVRPTFTELGEKSWDDLTPRVSVLYEINDDANVYATYSQGFKSGIFNTPGGQTVPVNPEEVTAYEAGIKSTPLPGLRLNAAVFHYDYKDLQASSVQLDANGVLQQRILNAASAKITGVEANLDWLVTDNFSLIAGVSYLDAKYESFPNAEANLPVASLPSNASCSLEGSVRPMSGLCQVFIDAGGNRMIRAPEGTASLTANYNREFTGGRLTLSGTAYLSSKVFFDFANFIKQPSYEKVNASAGWEFNNGVEVRVWGRNLTDRAVLTSVLTTNQYYSVDYERPREFGAELKYTF